MSKNINIEYCNGWGYGKSAERLQNILKQAFPEAKVNLSKSKEKTSRINVTVDKNAKNIQIWSDGKDNTMKEESQSKIIEKIK